VPTGPTTAPPHETASVLKRLCRACDEPFTTRTGKRLCRKCRRKLARRTNRCARCGFAKPVSTECPCERWDD